jgi:hypothetical protein
MSLRLEKFTFRSAPPALVSQDILHWEGGFRSVDSKHGETEQLLTRSRDLGELFVPALGLEVYVY